MRHGFPKQVSQLIDLGFVPTCFVVLLFVQACAGSKPVAQQSLTDDEAIAIAKTWVANNIHDMNPDEYDAVAEAESVIEVQFRLKGNVRIAGGILSVWVNAKTHKFSSARQLP